MITTSMELLQKFHCHMFLKALDNNEDTVLDMEAEAKYQCGHCDSMFHSMDDVQQHMLDLHMDSGVKVTLMEKSILPCQIYLFKFSYYSNIQQKDKKHTRQT